MNGYHWERTIQETKNLEWPMMLFLAEVCAVLSMMVVIGNLIRLFRKFSDEAYMDEEDEVIVELCTNEDGEKT